MSTPMKSIAYRGGIVTFRIPSQWKEEYSDIAGGEFYEDSPDAGTLRLTMLTVTAPERQQPTSTIGLLEFLKKSGLADGTARVRQDGNGVVSYEKSSAERGRKLAIFYWTVANPLPPQHVRIATFSYTVLAKHRDQPQIQREIAMLDAEIEAATFSSELGITAVQA